MGQRPPARARPITGRARLHAGRRRRGAGGAVAVPGRRLPVLPAAVPLPHHRPAARAALAGRGAGHAWCARCLEGRVRAAGRRADPRAGAHGPARSPPGGRIQVRGRARGPASLLGDGGGRARRLAGLRAGGVLDRLVRASRTRPAWSPRSARLFVECPAGLRAAAARRHRPRSTWRRTARSGMADYKTGRAPGPRGSRPSALFQLPLLRRGRSGAPAGVVAGDACGWSTSASGEIVSATRPTRQDLARHRAQGRGGVARHP